MKPARLRSLAALAAFASVTMFAACTGASTPSTPASSGGGTEKVVLRLSSCPTFGV